MTEKSLKLRRKHRISGVRYIFALVSFFCLITNYACRVNINVAIVAMVNNTAIYKVVNNVTANECSFQGDNFDGTSTVQKIKKDGEFSWPPQTQGLILGAFYYGYCLFQIPGGRLSEMYSGKWVFGFGTIFGSLMVLLTPTAARLGVTALIFVRALQGVSQGVLLPSMYSMISHWLPDSERGFFSAIMHSGNNIGVITGMTASGFLCNSQLFDGWPSAFYVFGFLNLLFVVLWLTLITSSPHSHPWISKRELKYIVSHQKSDMNSKVPPIPWRKLLTSGPLWALLITQVGIEWCFYIILNQLPTFFATVLHFDIEKNGFLSSVPFLVKAIIGILTGICTDALIRKGLATVNFVRKFCSSLSCLCVAVGLIGVCFAGCNSTLSVTLLMCSIPTIGFAYSGYLLSHFDLSPEYAGTLMGITNSIASVMGFTAPLFVGYMTQDEQTLHQWQIIFATAITTLLLSCFVYVFFGSSKKQNWITDKTEGTALIHSQEEEAL